MAEEEKPKQLVQMSTVVASGITAIVAALFTSRLGVAGTLLGTALTPMLMTIGVAILNAQIQRATDRISDLPSTVRGRLSTERVRVPDTPSPGPQPEDPEPDVTPRRRDRRMPGIFERLLSIPAFLRGMSPQSRRRTLLTGLVAGLVAAAIGLAGVTGIEAASGGPLYCTLYEGCTDTSASGDEIQVSGTSLFGSSGSSDTREEVPAGGGEAPAVDQQPPAEQPAPNADQTPQREEQYQGVPQVEEGGGQNEGTPVQPPAGEQEVSPDPAAPEGAAPEDDAPQQPSVAPDAGQPAAPSEQPQQ